MNEVAKELSEAEKLAKAEEFKAERAGRIVKLNTRVEPDRKAEMEDRLAKIAALRKIGQDQEEKARAQYLKRREREKAEEAEEKAKAEAEIKSRVDELLRKKSEEEPDAEVNEEEALKAEAPAAVTDLNPEEQRKRRIIRGMKLKEINAKYAVIRSYGGKCAIVTLGQSKRDPNKKVFEFQTKEAFDQWMANDFIPSLKKQNEKDAVGSWWFRHPLRREYDAVVFRPLAPRVITTSDRRRILNMYQGWGVEPKQGDWSLIRQHIKEVLANNDLRSDEYITRWNAWSFQHPDLLPEVALTLVGDKGTGKGTLARLLRIIFGPHSVQVSNIKHLTGTFNAYKENLIFLVADEAYWGGHKGEAGELQRMITEDTLFIEPKFFNQYEAKNYIHLLILAEPGWVIPAGPSERRYAVFGASDRHVGDRKYFKALHHEIDNGGAAAMLYDLQQMDLGDWHPREIYRTAALWHQQQRSLPPWDEWMLGLLEDGELSGAQPGRSHISTPAALLYDAHRKVPRLRDQGKMKLAEYLNERWEIFSQGGIAGNGLERGYPFPPLMEMRKAWDERFGARKWPAQAVWGSQPQPPLSNLLDEV